MGRIVVFYKYILTAPEIPYSEKLKYYLNEFNIKEEFVDEDILLKIAKELEIKPVKDSTYGNRVLPMPFVFKDSEADRALQETMKKHGLTLKVIREVDYDEYDDFEDYYGAEPL